ncbi:guanine deaminase [Tsukamurella paurometabola]|uniref:Guanine deaminase n=1 Tax=Tsukamurella paurometabola TaxID=2061 RepID=A0A3P8MCR1_TSUPA|nr:guanine deaminase [Tsukamurella paurometabola]UEA83758.1 guanine deaminase [Tsukamurella paurometabola]VDR40900.1 Guanine deaminase [Tsukamurella paurometabola]
MTIYRCRVLDTPDDPFAGGELRSHEDAGIAVEAGVIVDRGEFRTVVERHPGVDIVDLREGVLLPGLVDTHVHYPQIRAIGGLGMPLLDWLDQCALPEECKLADPEYARTVAREFLTGLTAAGTTTALVFGSHFADAVDALFDEADRVGVRVTAGLVTSDRNLPEPLLSTPARSYDEGRKLAERWHGHRRLRYAVTPRFSYSTSPEMLDSGAALAADVPGLWFTSHINENPAEIAAVIDQFPGSADYLDTYHRHGLIHERSVLAHNAHPTDAELALMAGAGASVAHCPTSNSALASGSFPLRRHLDHGVTVALGTDVGAGSGFSLFKEGLQAYFMQQLLQRDGVPLTAAHLLHLATRAGATALGLDDVGDLSVGRQFDAVLVRPTPGHPLDVGLRHAESADNALAKIFSLATPADIARVWVGGDTVVA